MHVIATAGHVDHGKSALVEALTGQPTDRLAEEKRRGLTIDLGFAWTSGQPWVGVDDEVAFVDVPGHDRFINTMIAGVAGVDAVLFVVAATEGWMPQSEEHLDVLSLLGIEGTVFAITMTDLVDADQVAMARAEIEERIAGGPCQSAEIIAVSARTGVGITELTDALGRLIVAAKPPPDDLTPRLWVDRSFTIRGFGTVVTGTLVGGPVAEGDAVVVWPGRKVDRIRALQSNGQPVAVAAPGSRLAMNLKSARTKDLARGSVVLKTVSARPVDRVGAVLQVPGRLPVGVTEKGAYHVHVGTGHVSAALHILGRAIEPGSRSETVLSLATALPVAHGDRLLVRDVGRRRVVAGGRVVMSGVAGSLRGGRLWEEIRVRAGMEREELADRVMAAGPWCTREDIVAATGWSDQRVEQHVESRLRQRDVVAAADRLYEAGSWQTLVEATEREIAAHHAAAPLSLGIGRAALGSRLELGTTTLTHVLDDLEAAGRVHNRQGLVASALHAIELTPEQERRAQELEALVARDAGRSSEIDTLSKIFDRGLIDALVEVGRLVRIHDDRVLPRRTYRDMLGTIEHMLTTSGSATVSEIRDALGTNRKVALALLYHCDRNCYTVRRSDDTRIWKGLAPDA